MNSFTYTHSLTRRWICYGYMYNYAWAALAFHNITCILGIFFFFFLEAAHLSKASFSEDNQEVKVLQLHLGQVVCPRGQLWAAADVDDGISTGALSLVNDRSLTKLIYQLWRERRERGEEERERERERERKKLRGREKHDNYLSGISGLQ